MKNPEYVKIKNKLYKINTDFRVAIKCNEIAMDNSIGDYERALAIIYILFGEDGLNDYKNYEELLKLAQKYLACGQEIEINNNDNVDMDYVEDMDLIEASFMSDYHIDLSEINMHWWKFNNLINGLSNSEMGNCCVLNRIRNLRNYDISEIKDKKERDKIIKAQKIFALNKNKKIPNKKQEQSAIELYKMLNL